MPLIGQPWGAVSESFFNVSKEGMNERIFFTYHVLGSSESPCPLLVTTDYHIAEAFVSTLEREGKN